MGMIRQDIPEDFYKGDYPVVYTVGELIEELKRLPEDLPITLGFNQGVGVVVYNVDRDSIHLSFEECEDF